MADRGKSSVPENLLSFINGFNLNEQQCCYKVEKTDEYLSVNLKWSLADGNRRLNTCRQTNDTCTQTDEINAETKQESSCITCECHLSPLQSLENRGVETSLGRTSVFEHPRLFSNDNCFVNVRKTPFSKSDVTRDDVTSEDHVTEENNSDDESTVSVSSLDSVEQCPENIKKFNSAIQKPRDVCMTQESEIGRKFAEKSVFYGKEAEEASDLFDISLPACVPAMKDSRITLSPIQEMSDAVATATEEPECSSADDVTINGEVDDVTHNVNYDVTRNGEVDDVTLNVNYDVTHNDEVDDVTHNINYDVTINGEVSECRVQDFVDSEPCKSDPESCVSVGYFYLQNSDENRDLTATPESPPDFVSTKTIAPISHSRVTLNVGAFSPTGEEVSNQKTTIKGNPQRSFNLEVLDSSKSETFSFGNIDEANLVKLYQENMKDLVVVRATKFRLSERDLCEVLSTSQLIDFQHIKDIYYDEHIMTRHSYIIQLKPDLWDVREKFKDGGKSLKLYDGDEVKLTFPQMRMLDKKWREKFEFC